MSEYNPKYMTVEGIPIEEIYMKYCNRCTGKQYKECEFSSYSICKYRGRSMTKEVKFYHGGLADTYEKQAKAQGFTFGDKAKWVQKIGFGIVCAHIHGCITEKEYDRILQRFQTKILVKNLKPIDSKGG